MHFYSNARANEATKFTADSTREQLSSFDRLERGIQQQRELMNTFDTNKRIGLMVDEWGVWDRMNPEEEKRYGRLWQQITIRAAVAAAMGLNVFHRQADKLVMCNIAQTMNVLHSLLLTDAGGPHCIRTPTYWAFLMAKDHRGKTALPADTGDTSPLGLSVSAARAEKQIVLTLVNPKPDAGMKVTCALTGATAASATAEILHHPDMNACNTFENPDLIMPARHRISLNAGRLETDLPPLSIVSAKVELS